MDLIATQAVQRGMSEEEVTRKGIDQIPLRKLGDPIEITNVVAFLTSNEATYITEAVIPVDGGFTRSPI